MVVAHDEFADYPRTRSLVQQATVETIAKDIGSRLE